MISITKMCKEHIDAVYAIECDSFAVPWSKDSLFKDFSQKHAHYFVAVDDSGEVCGYCGMWHIVNEGHITNIAVKPDTRRQGIGEKLVGRLIDLAYEKEMIGITLEVRMNNAPAHALYAHMGFKPEGIRKGYYSDTKEDAVIMWKYL